MDRPAAERRGSTKASAPIPSEAKSRERKQQAPLHRPTTTRPHHHASAHLQLSTTLSKLLLPSPRSYTLRPRTRRQEREPP